MAVGIALPIFALGASALGMSAEWGQHGPLVKGLLSVAGGVGSNGLFDWLKARWFTSPPGNAELLENHDLAGLVGTALERAFLLAAEQAEGDVALHSPRMKVLGGVAKERWLTLVDDEHTPQFDALRSRQFTDMVAGVCEGGEASVLEAEDWEPLVRGVDKLAGEHSLSMAAVTHTARVISERIARIFYELMKDARESSPEAYAALQLHFFADLKAAAASQNEQLAAIRTQLEALGAAIEDGAGNTASRRGKSFNWQRLTSMLRPMREMTGDWEKFYARHDQRWDAMIAKLDAIPEETSKRLWERLRPHVAWMLGAAAVVVALSATDVFHSCNAGKKLAGSETRENEANQRLAELQKRLDELLPIARAIQEQSGREANAEKGGATQTGGALAEAAARRKQTPEELRKDLSETAAEAARLAGEAAKTPGKSRDQERDYWTKAGDLALAANEAADAEKYFSAALQLTEKGTAQWCEVATGLMNAINDLSRIHDEEKLAAEIAAARGALDDVVETTDALTRHHRVLITLGRYVEAEAAAQKIIALEPKTAALPPKARAQSLVNILVAHSFMGNYRDLTRIAKLLPDVASADDSDGSRFLSAIARLSVRGSVIFVDDPGSVLAEIEQIASTRLDSPMMKSALITQTMRTVLDLHPRKPRPPRVEALLKQLAATAEALVGADFATCGNLLLKKAALLRADGRYEEELALIKRGLDLAKKEYPSGDPVIGLWECELARALTLPSEVEESEKLWRQGLAKIEHSWGASSSLALKLRSDFAIFLAFQKRDSEARAEQDKILAQYTTALGPDATGTIHAKFDLLPFLANLKKDDEVRKVRGEILAFLRNHPRPEQSNVIELFKRYQREPLSDAEYADFANAVEQAVERMDARGGSETLQGITFHAHLTEVRYALGNSRGAIEQSRRVVELAGAIFGAESVPTAMILRSHAGIHRRVGDFGGAEIPLREALRILEAATGRASTVVAETLVELASLLANLRNGAGAINTLQRALGILDARADDAPLQRYEAMARMGALLADDGQTAEAERLLRASIAEQEKASGFDPIGMEQRSVWLARLLVDSKRHEEAERILLRVIDTGKKFEDGTPAYRVSDAFFETMQLFIERDRAKEAEVRLRRFLTPFNGAPSNDRFTNRAMSLYSQSLVRLGLGQVDAQARRAKVLRGEKVPDL